MPANLAPKSTEPGVRAGGLEAAIGRTDDLIAVVTFDGCFEAFSPSWIRTLGWSEQELQDKAIWQLIHPDDMEASQAAAAHHMAKGGHLSGFTNRYLCKDGSYVPLTWTNYTDLEAQKVYAVARHVTGAGPETELMWLFSITEDLIAVGSLGGSFDILSPSWVGTLGWSLDELKGMAFTDLIHPDDLAASVAHAEALQSGASFTQNFVNRYRCKDGQYKHLSWTAYAEMGAGRLYCIARDVTDIRAQANRLDEQAQAWETFAHTLAHDVRSPIRSVSGLAQMLQRTDARLADDDTQRLLQMIIDRVHEVDVMTGKLLDFARIGTAALERTDIDMQLMVMAQMDLARESVEGPAPTLAMGTLPPCRGDATLLARAVANLLQNACKFAAGPAAVVRVTAECGEGTVTYHFHDNGIGFAANMEKRIWDPRVRDDSAATFAGTGLGLATVKRIVETHGGTVACSSAGSDGTTFSFSLPT